MRIVVGFLFLCHGTQKILGFPPGASGKVTQLFTSVPGWSGVLELSGGALARLQAMTPPDHQAQIDLSITDDWPLAQAFVIISAVLPGKP